ncbi:methyltransferase domain-containing protein [Azospirillum sp. SYSU D00513]|uniref:class I SAM-dependent methyltransferase n=1 Tax=Azospirillum sp. SYSU D00513 TaxID=2812561 RepID=UPI001A9687DA|nr:methyltransferase domain-containing protein [Azospirillum sp. SYSU D00513]
MYTDIVDLREFYESGLGQVARRMIRRRIRTLWPDVRGQIVLGIGYATPYLRPFRDEADRVLAVMPASQGVSYWPREGPGMVALGDEAELPLADMSVDRVLLVHGLEGTEQLRPMMREIWRVLAGGGRVLVVVPNRRGLWARADWTPFGHGFPYSGSQLKQVLRDTMFVPERTGHALFIPPLRSRFLLSTAPAWEEAGERWFKAFAGVTMIEASKQIFAGVARKAQPVRRRLIVPLPGGAAAARRQVILPSKDGSAE